MPFPELSPRQTVDETRKTASQLAGGNVLKGTRLEFVERKFGLRQFPQWREGRSWYKLCKDHNTTVEGWWKKQGKARNSHNLGTKTIFGGFSLKSWWVFWKFLWWTSSHLSAKILLESQSFASLKKKKILRCATFNYKSQNAEGRRDMGS